MFPEILMRSRSVAVFVKAVWELGGGGKQLGIAYDQASVFVFSQARIDPSHQRTHGQLVSQSLRFISATIRSAAYRDIFEAHDTIRGLAGVVVPNLALRT
jgi:exportin-2 (importin alpha re-exporter)